MKIMLVEDEAKLASLIKRGLERSGYTVEWVSSGSQALERLTTSHSDYNLAILDRMLPGIDGLSICKELRQLEIDLPIIILTALSSTNDRIEGLNQGADDYIVKPFALNELVARIRTVLRRPAVVLPVRLKVNDLIIDTSTRQVWRNKQEIALTSKEFSLLEFFALHPGQVLEREQILSKVWDFAFDSFSNVVDVHIKNLRRKIDHGHSEKIFETVRGVGYRLKD